MNFKNIIAITRFNKPIGSLLLLYPTLCAMIICYNSSVSMAVIVVFILSVFLTRSAGCVINDICDSDIDDKVKRTESRPLATKAMTSKQAWCIFFAIVFVTFIIALLVLKCGTILLSIPALFLFSTYPLMKRYFVIPQLYLGLSYSFSVIMVCYQFIGYISYPILLLYFANVIWVVAYDTYYALVDIEYDKKIGVKSSAITFGNNVKIILGIAYLLFFAILFYLGYYLEYTLWYFIINFGAMLYVFAYWYIIKIDDTAACFRFFLNNNKVGALVTLAFLLHNLHFLL